MVAANTLYTCSGVGCSLHVPVLGFCPFLPCSGVPWRSCVPDFRTCPFLHVPKFTGVPLL